MIELSHACLEGFFSDLGFRLEILNSSQRQLDRHVASRFNVFEFIETNENVLSDLLRLLLSPDGSHGQGSLFIELFLKRLNLSTSALLDHASVTREALTYSIKKELRRIDILVSVGGWYLAIENKLDAGEQPEQLTDYKTHLSKIAKNNFVLIFLTPEGKQPVTLSDARKLEVEKRLFCLSYHANIIPWLEECRRECEAEKIRYFLQDLIRFIKETIRPAEPRDTNEERIPA